MERRGRPGASGASALKDLSGAAQTEDNAVAQAVETIRNRVDEFGVAEPLIAREGTDRILVQLPGIDDPKRVKDLIKSTAFLELKLVEQGPRPTRTRSAPNGAGPAQTRARRRRPQTGRASAELVPRQSTSR